MSGWNLKRRESRRGVAAVEFAVVLPLLCVLIFGVWEVSRLINVQQVMCNAVREGGRQVSTGVRSYAEIKQVVVNYLAEQNITITTSDVSIANSTNASNTDPTVAAQLDRFRVTVTVAIASVRWLSPGFYKFTGNMTASSDWFSMNDTPLTVSNDVPIE